MKERRFGSFKPWDAKPNWNEAERESEAQKWFTDPKLMHKNPPYSRKELVNQISRETHNPELLRAYTDIIKFNEEQNERNYMVDIYRALRDGYLG